MRKKIREIPGDVIKIPFNEGVHTYGRILANGNYVIYDSPSKTDRSDYANIVKSDVLFVALVNTFAVQNGYWPIVTHEPLDDSLKAFRPIYFNPAPTNSQDVEFYKSHIEEIERAIKKDWIKTGIQIGGIHDLVHIESRISDYYNGKMNEFNKRSIFVFKKFLGLPI